MKRLSMIAFAILLAVPVFAEELPPALRVVASVLELSEPQLQGLVAAVQACDAAVRPIAEQLQAKHQALAQLVQSESPDAAAVGTLILEIRAAEKEIAAVAHGAAEAFERSLTPEQRERLNAIRGAMQVCEVIPAFRAVGLL